MVKREPTQFSEALSYLLKDKGHGSSADLARFAGVAEGYISELKKSKKDGSETVRRSAAQFLGIEYGAMLGLGQWILDGSDPDTYMTVYKGMVGVDKKFIEAYHALLDIPFKEVPQKDADRVLPKVINLALEKQWLSLGLQTGRFLSKETTKRFGDFVKKITPQEKPNPPLGMLCHLPNASNKNQAQLTEWIHLQDDPGKYWSVLSWKAEKEFPGFAEFLKKTSGDIVQNG